MMLILYQSLLLLFYLFLLFSFLLAQAEEEELKRTESLTETTDHDDISNFNLGDASTSSYDNSDTNNSPSSFAQIEIDAMDGLSNAYAFQSKSHLLSAAEFFPPAPLDVILSDLSLLKYEMFAPLIWMAPFLSGGGYCSEALSFVLSLALYLSPNLLIVQHGDVLSVPFFRGLPEETQDLITNLMYSVVNHEESVIICHSEPGAWYPANYQTSRCPSQSNVGVTIGRTMFETDRIPEGWPVRLQKMDFIWVPTKFHQTIFTTNTGLDIARVRVIPEPVDTEFFSPSNVKPYEYVKGERKSWLKNSTKKPFRFLSIFKWEERKGWKFLLEAYLREFKATDKVELWILTAAYHSESDFQDEIEEFIQSSREEWQLEDDDTRPALHLLRSNIPTSSMPSVYSSSDCFVLPSRGEGWGRPHVEAMSMALPIIATYWSGPTEYMNQNNSYPLRYEEKMDVLEEGPFQGHEWVRPSVSHLRELMREVYSNQEEAKKKGLRARADMQEKYCPTCVARLVLQELARFPPEKIRERIRAKALVNKG